MTLISIVSGTFNRLGHLQAMMTSARMHIPRGMDYEFVIVDGGSTDGTLEMLRQQPDVRLIEHGGLHGAIKAFCDGAAAARGEYVLLANDDVVFTHNSIVPAIVHLERNPHCGAVAYQDNRPVPNMRVSAEYKALEMAATDTNGRNRSVLYAQVGLFRKWLGDMVGWWGAGDPDFDGHTYGGDNYLSAKIWEIGYTVEIVAGCNVSDNIARDELRSMNQKREDQNPGAYYRRFPTGPQIAERRDVDNPQSERLRVLYLPIYEPGHDIQQRTKRGLRDALKRVGLVYEVDYLNHHFDPPHIVEVFQPHLLLAQIQDPTALPQAYIRQMREAKPDMVAVNWNGDVWPDGLTSKNMLSVLRHFDLQLTVNANVLELYEQEGIPAAYWQIGFEPVDEPDMPVMRGHDVVFLANAYDDNRKVLEATLSKFDVGFYGSGWDNPAGQSLYDFATGRAIYRNAKIAIGDNLYPDERGFVSNRLFEALAGGVLLLHQHIDGLEELTGLQDGVHYVAWTDSADLKKKLRYWLAKTRTDKREALAREGLRFVHERHSFDARVRELLTELLPRVERVRV